MPQDECHDLPSREPKSPLRLFTSPPHPCRSLVSSFSAKDLPEIWKVNSEVASLTSLAADWEKQHMCLRANEWSGPRPRAPRRSCHDAGVCVCQRNPEYRRVRKMYSRVSAYLKRITAEESMSKTLLDAGLIVHWQA